MTRSSSTKRLTTNPNSKLTLSITKGKLSVRKMKKSSPVFHFRRNCSASPPLSMNWLKTRRILNLFKIWAINIKRHLSHVQIITRRLQKYTKSLLKSSVMPSLSTGSEILYKICRKCTKRIDSLSTSMMNGFKKLKHKSLTRFL